MKNSDLQSVTPAELKIGMYVILPLAWHQHPFLKSHFLIQSEAQINKIRELGTKGIRIDLSKSRPVEASFVGEPQASSALGQQKPAQKVATDDLIATIRDGSLPPQKKSQLVWQHSITMMKNLLENPTTQNMKEAQKGISEMVSLILADDDTLHYLLGITSHDYYTYAHSVSVGVLGIALAKSLYKDSTKHDIRALGVGFFLHDVGKVGIDPSIITKPGKLTFEEMQEMKRHPSLGYKLLYDTRQLTEEAKTIVLQHHERVDGAGYPKGLRDREIHIYGRICSIADVYDALTSDRPYRKKMSPFAALKIMQDEMIHHFQKDLFQKFVLMFKAPA
jgi:HD-GYP domain-containing protein (c-di-GMP phosphodiesterase class II)